MRQEDKKEFIKLFMGISELYEKRLSEALISLYFESLKEFSIENIKKSFNLHAKTSKFFPKPSDLLELIEGNREEKGIVAWKDFREAIRHQGADNSVIFEDPKISWIVESYGGWIKVCGMETKDLDFMRVGFLKAYNSLNHDLPQKKLIGLTEWENERGGFIAYISKPKVIGKSERLNLIEDGRSGLKTELFVRYGPEQESSSNGQANARARGEHGQTPGRIPSADRGHGAGRQSG